MEQLPLLQMLNHGDTKTLRNMSKKLRDSVSPWFKASCQMYLSSTIKQQKASSFGMPSVVITVSNIILSLPFSMHLAMLAKEAQT